MMLGSATALNANVLIAAKTGERSAFSQLWRVHQGHLLRYRRAKRVANPEDVEMSPKS
jgi:hypothetical protein